MAVRIVGITAELQALDFQNRASTTSLFCHIRMAKLLVCCLAALPYIEVIAMDVVWVALFQENVLFSFIGRMCYSYLWRGAGI